MSRFANKAKPAAAAPVGNKPKNITVLDIRQVETKSGTKTKVQFAKGITIQYNGENIDLGEYNSAFMKDRAEMQQDFEFFISKGIMDEEKANEEIDRIEQKGIQYVYKVKL